MIRVTLPHHLRALAQTGKEVTVPVEAPVTITAVLTALETHYPTLRGTIRDYGTGKRRPFIRFFVCGQDWSHKPPDTLLPEAIASGAVPFMVIGAMAGG